MYINPADSIRFRYLVRQTIHLILSATDSAWSYQGFGMLRLYGNFIEQFSTRLHIWNPEIRERDDVSLIHDHPWDFESIVLAGQICDKTYEITDRDIYQRYNRMQIQCGEGGCSLGEPEVVRMRTVSDRTYGPGQTYNHKAPDIHASHPMPGTVTLVTRETDPKNNPDHANVFYDFGGTWVSAEPRPARGREINPTVALAVSKLQELL